MRSMKTLYAAYFALLASTIASTALATPLQEAKVEATSVKSEPTEQQRLDRLCEQLEKQRVDLHIPGFAIAIVRNDKVILSKGFGMRDVERGIPVTPQTLFAIGSSSKAFTSATIAMLIDEGKMSWDDPVTRHLPQFKLFDAEASEKITIRDLLCHRSGLERTDLVWASGQASREEILAAIATAEPKSKFREAFHYQNVMFLAAGLAAANAAGLSGDWDRLIAERLFAPLGMKDSNTDIEAAQRDPNLSLGYQWVEDKNEFKHLPMRKLNTIAPAGAINSNVIDMAQWLRLQLNRGEIDGKRLIAEARFDEMREKQIAVAEGAGIDYGLAWMLHDWQGRKVVEHGGNIDGFGAQVTLVPEENLGYVLLTNVTATPLQSMSINLVCESLLGDWSTESDSALDPSTVEKYLGKYHFDVLKRDVTVLMKDGKLAVDVPGQMVFTVKRPDAQGKWVFDLTDTIAVSFVEDDAGHVQAMNFHQSGLIMECVKEGVTLPTEIGLDEAQKYLGKYRDEENQIDVTVLHRNGRLAIDVPGQMVFDLRLPGEDGKWVFRATDAIAVRFEQDAAGTITGMTHFQGGKERLARRVAGADAANVPTVEQLLELHERGCGSDGVAGWSATRITARMKMVNQGLNDIRMTEIVQGIDRFAQHLDMGKFGWIRVGLDGATGWTDSAFAPGEEVAADVAPLMRLQNPLLPVIEWRGVFSKIEIVRVDKVNDREVYVVDLSSGADVRCLAFVEQATGRPVRIDYQEPVPNIGAVETQMTLSDWRETEGVVFPFRWEIDHDIYGRIIVEVEQVETRIDLPDDAFARPNR